MSAKNRKIHIATDEEVKEYGGPAGGQADRQPDPGQAPAGAAGAAGAAKEPAGDTAALQKQLEEVQDKLLRAKAESQNLLRRTATEKAEAIRFALEDFAKALLPVVDDFERTLRAGQESSGNDAVLEGVRLVYDKLAKVLRDHHVTAIEALHKPFDPAFHSAVMQRPSLDHEPGTVTEEVQRGYCLRDRVIRPSQVIIAAPPPGDTENNANPNEDRN